MLGTGMHVEADFVGVLGTRGDAKGGAQARMGLESVMSTGRNEGQDNADILVENAACIGRHTASMPGDVHGDQASCRSATSCLQAPQDAVYANYDTLQGNAHTYTQGMAAPPEWTAQRKRGFGANHGGRRRDAGSMCASQALVGLGSCAAPAWLLLQRGLHGSVPLHYSSNYLLPARFSPASLCVGHAGVGNISKCWPVRE